MDVLHRRGRATVGEVMGDLTGEPAYSTVRAQLRVLEQKGHVRHEEHQLRYVYLPAASPQTARRSALNHLLALQESDPYLRGLVVWIGFQQAFVPYEREARHAGTTHFPFFSRNPWKTFAIGLTSFSFMPIFTVIGAAATAAIVTGVLVLVTLLLLVARGTVSTTLTLVTIGAVFWTTILAAIAAVGIYVIRIYKDVRNRPQYIVESTIGLSQAAEEAPAERALP